MSEDAGIEPRTVATSALAVRDTLKFNPFSFFQDDNFVLSAVFCAIEEDNKTGLEELLAMANIDISQVGRGPLRPSG